MAIPALDERSLGLLRLATSAEVSDNVWRAWSAANRLEDLSPPEAMLLAPIASRRVRATQGGGDDRLAGVARHWWSRNSALLALIGTAQARLRRAGISPVLTGPAAIGFVHAGNLATRPVPRAEIGVEARDVPAALQALSEEPWDASRSEISGPGDLRDGGELRTPSGSRLLLRWRIPGGGALAPVEINGVPASVPALPDVLADLIARPDSWSPASALLWEVDLALILRARPDLASREGALPALRIEDSARERLIRLRDLGADELLSESLSSIIDRARRRRPARWPAVGDWPAARVYLQARWRSRGPADFSLQLARRALRRAKIG